MIFAPHLLDENRSTSSSTSGNQQKRQDVPFKPVC